jgi:hypothetical protein
VESDRRVEDRDLHAEAFVARDYFLLITLSRGVRPNLSKGLATTARARGGRTRRVGFSVSKRTVVGWVRDSVVSFRESKSAGTT